MTNKTRQARTKVRSNQQSREAILVETGLECAQEPKHASDFSPWVLDIQNHSGKEVKRK